MKFMSVATNPENYKIRLSAKRKDKAQKLKDKKNDLKSQRISEEYEKNQQESVLLCLSENHEILTVSINIVS